MAGDSHEGMVAFLPLARGREQIMLGRVPVGEIGPAHGARSRFPTCFRIDLPGASSRAWHPTRSIEDARRQAAEKINDWLDAADLRPAARAGRREARPSRTAQTKQEGTS